MPPRPLRIFLSYGHDKHAADALCIKADLERRSHQVWFDLERIKAGRDWEAYIEEGLKWCDKVVLLMTPYSVRRRDPRDPTSRDGYCLNEIAKAIERNKLIIPVLLVELEAGPPTSICRIQYLDLRDAVPISERKQSYVAHFDRLVRAIEQDEMDFEGGQARLSRLLKPINFDAEIRRHIAHFSGRQWLLKQLDHWLEEDVASRVFWLTGRPGIGKTALATHLCHTRGDVIAYHLCVHGHDDKADPRRALLSIAYQMAQHLPEYYRRLSALELEAEASKSAGALFDNLIVRPLSEDFRAPTGHRLVVMDAIDEATKDGRNEIVECIWEHWDKTPSWLRLVITSRPESEILAGLPHLPVHRLDDEEGENRRDLHDFLLAELQKRRLASTEEVLRKIVARSEGLFLYAVVVLEELDSGRLSVDRLEEFPDGLAGHYRRFFQRQFPDVAAYRSGLKPVLESICAQRDPLPVALLAASISLGSSELQYRLGQLGSLFPIHARTSEQGRKEEVVSPFHKSVADWLAGTDERAGYPKAGNYGVDVAKGQERLAEACWAECRRSVAHASAYALRHLPAHLIAAEQWDRLADALSEYGFVEAKVAAGMVFDLARDYSSADVALSAAGLGDDRCAALRDWRNFVWSSAHKLALGQEPFVQLARNYASDGPVAALAERHARAFRRPWFQLVNRPARVENPACLHILAGHAGEVYAVAVLPDGRRAISGGADCTLIVWDLDSGQRLGALEGHTGTIYAAAVTPDGRWAVSGGNDMTVMVWDLATGLRRHALQGHEGCVTCLAISADGREILSGGNDAALRVWDLASGRCVRTLNLSAGAVKALAVASDGRRVVVRSGTTLQVLDLQSGKAILTLPGHTSVANTMAVTPDGACAVSGTLTRLRVWDLAGGQCLRMLQPQDHWVCGVAVTADGKYVLNGNGNEVRVSDLQTGQCLRALEGHSARVLALAVTGDGSRAVSAGDDRTVRVWDLRGGQCRPQEEVHREPVLALAITPDGRSAVSGSRDTDLRVWNAELATPIRALQGHTEEIWGLAFSPDGGRVLSASGDQTLRVWSLHDGRCLHVLDGHAGRVRAVAIVPSGACAVSASEDRSLRVWDLRDGQCVRLLQGHSASVLAVVATADDRMAISASADKTLRVWDLDSGGCLRVLEGHTGTVSCVALTPDGRQVVSGSLDNTLRVWDLQGGRCVWRLGGHTDSVRGLAISPDGRWAASAGEDHVLRTWDMQSGQPCGVLSGHRGPVRFAAIAADGQRVISGSDDNTLRLWNRVTGEELACWSAGGRVGACAEAPDGGRIMVADSGGHVYCLLPRNVPAGPAIVTAWHCLADGSLGVGCPLCHTGSQAAQFALGTDWPCPNCGKTLRVNPFAVNADWRAIAKTWRRQRSTRRMRG